MRWHSTNRPGTAQKFPCSLHCTLVARQSLCFEKSDLRPSPSDLEHGLCKRKSLTPLTGRTGPDIQIRLTSAYLSEEGSLKSPSNLAEVVAQQVRFLLMVPSGCSYCYSCLRPNLLGYRHKILSKMLKSGSPTIFREPSSPRSGFYASLRSARARYFQISTPGLYLLVRLPHIGVFIDWFF